MKKLKKLHLPRLHWAKVSEKNEWGKITTYVGKEEFVLPKNKKCLVMFPDGETQLVKVVMNRHTEHVCDMGNEYEVYSNIPYIVIKYHGLTIETKLANRRLKVWAANVCAPKPTLPCKIDNTEEGDRLGRVDEYD